MFGAMPPKQVLTSSKVVRLSQDALLSHLHAWEVAVPEGADDLDMRSMLSRAMRGQPPLSSPQAPTGDIVPASTGAAEGLWG